VQIFRLCAEDGQDAVRVGDAILIKLLEVDVESELVRLAIDAPEDVVEEEEYFARLFAR
jgi:sRNA-binding carbon storage regulator CsrA